MTTPRLCKSLTGNLSCPLPAEVEVFWPGQTTESCKGHAEGQKRLAEVMGFKLETRPISFSVQERVVQTPLTIVRSPSIGRIVHYSLIDTGKTVPAIVVDVAGDDLRVDLFVMCSSPPDPMKDQTWIEKNVLYSEESKPGYWRWPSRV